MPREFQRFRFRRFATNVLLLSFLVSAVSGIILFVRPEGSLARWVGWTVLGLDKAQWEAVHIVFVSVLVLASLVHVWFNWSAIVAYIRQKAAKAVAPRRLGVPSGEFLAAIGVVLTVLAGTLVETLPFTKLLALRAAVKDGAFAAAVPPPAPNADRYTFADFCRQASIPEAQALVRARSQGIDVPNTSMTIADIARAHNLSPEAVFQAIRRDHGPSLVQP